MSLDHRTAMRLLGFALGLALFGLWLVSCGGPLGRYNEQMGDEFRDHVSLMDADNGLDRLVMSLASAGLIGQDESVDLLQRAWMRVHGVEPPLTLGDCPPVIVGALSHPVCVDGKRRVYGYNDGGYIALEWTPDKCFARTAFLHEATHSILCRAKQRLSSGYGGAPHLVPDCDPDHQLDDWWLAQERAVMIWSADTCDDVKARPL